MQVLLNYDIQNLQSNHTAESLKYSARLIIEKDTDG
jgi:hypothetical protein